MMMIWTEARKQSARDAAERFRGTPHRNRIAIPGVGVDCIFLALEIYWAAGIIPRCGVPQYSPALGILRTRNVARDIFMRCAYFEDVGRNPELGFGDLIIFAVGRVANHVGVMIDGACVHSAARVGVLWTTPTAGFCDKIETVLRSRAEGLRCDPASIDATALV